MNSNLKNILEEIDALKKRLDSYRPLNEAQLKKIEEAFFIEYTYESNRIEGSTLTLQETALVIQKGITISNKSMREHLEAINHYEAIGFIHEVVASKEFLNEKTIKDIHALVLRGIDKENAGRYRTLNVKIAGSRHLPPDSLKVQELMDDYFSFYDKNKSALHPVLLAAHLHEKLVTIHPFIDGNGRTSRLVMNLILLQNGYSIANIAGSNENRLRYYNSLDKCQTENLCDDFHLFVAETEKQSLQQYLKVIENGK